MRDRQSRTLVWLFAISDAYVDKGERLFVPVTTVQVFESYRYRPWHIDIKNVKGYTKNSKEAFIDA